VGSLAESCPVSLPQCHWIFRHCPPNRFQRFGTVRHQRDRFIRRYAQSVDEGGESAFQTWLYWAARLADQYRNSLVDRMSKPVSGDIPRGLLPSQAQPTNRGSACTPCYTPVQRPPSSRRRYPAHFLSATWGGLKIRSVKYARHRQVRDLYRHRHSHVPQSERCRRSMAYRADFFDGASPLSYVQFLSLTATLSAPRASRPRPPKSN
jgi:hypothetical protein